MHCTFLDNSFDRSFRLYLLGSQFDVNFLVIYFLFPVCKRKVSNILYMKLYAFLFAFAPQRRELNSLRPYQISPRTLITLKVVCRLATCKMSASINVHEQETSDTSFSSSGGQKPLIHHERNRFVVALVIITSLLLIWGVSLLPTIFYANKLSVSVEQQESLNTR